MLSFDFYVIDAGVLSKRVISEDINSLNIFFFSSCLTCNLGQSSIMIQSGQASHILLFDCRSEMTQDKSVCVGGICNYDTFHIRACKFESMRLLDKDSFVFLEKIFSLHSRFSRLSSYENYNISIFEHFFSFVTIFDLNRRKTTDLRGAKLQSSSSRATPCITLTAGVISSILR